MIGRRLVIRAVRAQSGRESGIELRPAAQAGVVRRRGDQPVVAAGGSTSAVEASSGDRPESHFPSRSLSLPEIDPADLSHDAQAVQRHRDDPLVFGHVSVRLGLQMLAAGRWALQHADELTLPTLLMHGAADRLTSAEASREFAQRAGPVCTLRVWPDLFHELHWETQRTRCSTRLSIG
jgi:alpha-beta hydrolase superfamily lysophospholipase